MDIIRSAEQLREFITKFAKTNTIVANGIGFYGNGLAVSPVEVRFHFDAKKEGKKETFASEDLWGYKDKWTLGKNGLNKIASAIGLTWISSRIVDTRLDQESGRVNFVKHEVTWRRPTTSGIDQTGISTGEYSYYEDFARLRHKEDVFEKTWNAAESKYVNTSKKLASKGDPITDQVERRRNYSGSLAETNAKIRALNEALPELPRNWTMEDIKKPLIVFRVVVDIAGIAEMNPALTQVYHAKLLGLADVIYNQPMQNQILIDQRPQVQQLNATAKIEDQFGNKEISTTPIPDPQKEPEPEQTLTELDTEIEDLIRATNYKGKALKSWKNFELKLKKDFLANLQTLPKVAA